MANKFDSSEAVKYGWEKMRENTWFFIQVMLVIFSVQILFGFIQEVDVVKQSRALDLGIGLVSWVVSGLLEMGAIFISLETVRGRKAELEQLFSQSEKIADFILANILFGLKVLLGLILLVVPGIIWAIKHMFYGYLIVDKGEKAISSLTISGKITEGEKWNLFIFGLYCLGINLLGLLFFVVGLLFTIPATIIATSYVYEKLINASLDIKKESDSPLAPTAG